MKKKFQFDFRLLIIPLFWGSLWGFAEATLGHLLHWMRVPGLAGLVMFPLGVFFMTSAFISSGQKKVIFMTAFVAGSLKLTDLFFPFTTVFMVFNPALAIVFESLAVLIFLAGKNTLSGRLPLGRLLGMTVIWRGFYAGCIGILSVFYQVDTFLDLGRTHVIHFFLVESAANFLLLFLLFRTLEYFRNDFSVVKRYLSKGVVSVFIFLVVLCLKLLV